MKPAAIAACLALAACSLQQPPRAFEAAHVAAKNRITYQNYAARDWRYIPPTETGQGNCAVFAFTVWVDANKAGLTEPTIHLCRLPSGIGHAYTRSQGWDSDVRYKTLIPSAQNDCVDAHNQKE